MSEEIEEQSLVAQFSVLEDPRDSTKVRHKLLDIVAISIAAVIAGADNWVDVAEFAQSKEDWLCEFLGLENGIPSHDTFRRVFSLLRPEAFEECFRAWVASMRQMLPGEIVAIDGKSSRRSHDRGAGLGALHLVSAWAADNRLVLAQVATEQKSNEITAIPRLLELLVLKGCIVTIDAMGCQTKIAEQIIDAGADYVLALKGNQSTLAEEVEDAFIDADARDYADMEVDVLETVEKGHGRKERRRYTVLGDLRGVSRQSLWKGLDAICMVESEREIDGHTSRECRYYIGSIGANAEQFANAVRAHWTIENSLHWTLDVAFREDESRLRDPSGRENFAVLRHMALARLKNDKSTKTGIKNKRLKAGWNNDYLAKLLMQSPLAAP
jgi:predicted transposase YbfD/YdcC